MRRDFGNRSLMLALAKKNIGGAIAMRPLHRMQTTHQTVDRYEPVEDQRAKYRSDAQGQETRWRSRSTLLLVLSVGALFWGGVFWLFFG
jgi:hypothetical protein